MKKIDVVNATPRIERLTQALAEGNTKSAKLEAYLMRAELNRRKRSAKYYANRYSDARGEVAKAQLKSIERDLATVRNAEKLITRYGKNPSKIRLNSTIVNLNKVDQTIREVNMLRIRKTNIIKVKAEEKVDVLFTRLFLNNEVYDSTAIFAIGEKIKKILPDFDLQGLIRASFDVAKHFNSGDEQEAIVTTAITGHFGLYGTIQRERQNLTSDQLDKLQQYYDDLMNEMGAY